MEKAKLHMKIVNDFKGNLENHVKMKNLEFIQVFIKRFKIFSKSFSTVDHFHIRKLANINS